MPPGAADYQELLAFAYAVGKDALHCEFDMATVALVDTACTLCMHSKLWREAYEKYLPEHLVCKKTDRTRNFSFANGSREKRVPVYIIPIGIAGYSGEVHSTEVPTGKTPLLISLSALDALDAKIDLRGRKVAFKALDVVVPLIPTPTRHLGINIAEFSMESDQ